MSSISEELPIWTLEEENLVNSCRRKRRAKETIKIRVNYSGKSQTGQLRSPDFVLKRLNNSSWYLTIDPKVKEINTGIDYISVYLHLRERNNKSEKFNGEIAMFQISYIDSKGDKIINKTSEKMYFCGVCGWGWKFFMKRSAFLEKSKRINGSINQFNLLLGIHLIEVKDLNAKNKSENEESDYEDFNGNDTNFQFNHDLMNDKEYCDIRFIVKDSDFKAHSRLLASKIIDIQVNVAKNKNNEFLITEFDAEVFYELITFVYKGYAPNIEKYCDKLLIAADYYGISKLKSMCDCMCFRKLTPEIAIDVLTFAVKYKAFSVKVRAISYTAINLKEVIKSSQVKWKQFKKSNESLVEQIITIRRMKCQCNQHKFIIQF